MTRVQPFAPLILNFNPRKPDGVNETLQPNDIGHVVQGFQTMLAHTGKKDGALTSKDIERYRQKAPLAFPGGQDPVWMIAWYFKQNFPKIAGRDGFTGSISLYDLIQWPAGLPKPY